MILKIEPFEPASLLEVLQSTAKVLAQSKGLALISTLDAALPPRLLGDAYRLRQILLNLLSNAVKFTQHGSVTVRLQRVDDAHWALQVTDTGPGISADVQARVFEAFWKGPVGQSQAAPLGSGLGLAVVKELTTLMGGQVTLESTLGQGSTFTVSLPMAAAPELETVR